MGTVNQLTKCAIETRIAESLSGIADHDRTMSANWNIFEFLNQIWMDEKRGRAIVSSQPFAHSLSGYEELLSVTYQPSLESRCKTMLFVMRVGRSQAQ